MSNTQITGGYVTYGQTVKVTEYEPKKAEAQLSFAVADGSDFIGIFEIAAQTAVNKVHELLGLPARKWNTVNPSGDVTLAVKTAEPEKPKNKPGRPPKAKEPDAHISTGGERKDPAVDEIDGLGDDTGAPIKKTPEAPGTTDAEDWEKVEEKPAEITDKALTDALTKKNGELKNGPLIRGLVAEFAGEGKRSIDIPQAKRQAFLDKLKGLKNPA